MMKRCATYALFAAVTAMGTAPALAQSVPEGQSCGGLLCDMGVFGHKTPPKAEAASTPVVAPPAPTRRAEAARPADDLTPEPSKRIVRKKKRIAKIAPPVAPAPKAPRVAAQIPAQTRAAARPSAAVQAPVVAQVPKPQPAPAAAAANMPASTGQGGNASAAALPPPPLFRFRTLY